MGTSRVDGWRRGPAVQRRIGAGLAAFTLAAMLLATLYPFRFQLETASWARIDWRLYYPGHSDRDLLLNLVMLSPLGAAIALVRFGCAGLARVALEACAVGLASALVVETLQIFERTRYPQAADVWRNGVGCGAGALAVALILRAMGRKRGL